MGKASRRKVERKKGIVENAVSVEDGRKKIFEDVSEPFKGGRRAFLSAHPGPEKAVNIGGGMLGRLKKAEIPFKGVAVYRSLKSAAHADDLVAGKLWISTLSTCRKYEDPLQGDSDEAIHRYSSGSVSGGGDDLDFVKIAERAGIYIGQGCSDISLSNAYSVEELKDAFVLCTSEDPNPNLSNETFGNYCVEILDPSRFFMAVNKAMENDPRFQRITAAWGAVLYRERSYIGLQDPPGPIGFVKPIKYQHQKEVRFLWGVDGMREYTPFSLYVPELKKLCRRIK